MSSNARHYSEYLTFHIGNVLVLELNSWYWVKYRVLGCMFRIGGIGNLFKDEQGKNSYIPSILYIKRQISGLYWWIQFLVLWDQWRQRRWNWLFNNLFGNDDLLSLFIRNIISIFYSKNLDPMKRHFLVNWTFLIIIQCTCNVNHAWAQ